MRSFTLTSLLATLITGVATAQKKPLIDIDIDKTEWYENPILWVGVAAFFILLIVLTRRKAS